MTPMRPTLLDCFGAIAIINLPERRDRRREMNAELKRRGLAVDGGSVHFFPALRPGAVGDWPSIGARGCFLSHLGVLKRARERRDSSVLILEDDCEFEPCVDGTVEALAQALPQSGWGIAYVGHKEDVGDAPVGTWLQTDRPIGLAHC